MEKKPSRRPSRMDNRLIKPLLLKDYLVDELSSCSSNGFKSFPRRHCCTTPTTTSTTAVVRFLVDKDLNLNPKLKPSWRRSADKTRPRTAASTAISAFQKASDAVLSAVKLLSVHNRSSVKSGFLARSFSRKVFKRTFWRKSGEGQIKDSEIHRWKTFHNLISEFPETPIHLVPTPSAAITAATTTSDSTSDDHSKSGSSWSDNEFSSGSEYLHSHEDRQPVQKSKDRSTDDAGEDSSDSAAEAAASFVEPADNMEKQWMAKDEKEQLSPVSVLESPFDGEDGDDGSSKDLDNKLVRIEGTNKKLMQRLRRFETLAETEPVDLDKRLASLFESEDNVKNGDMVKLDHAEKAQDMLELVKSRMIPAWSSEMRRSYATLDNLLLDFFMDSLRDQADDREVTDLAESYLSGEGTETASDWRVEESGKSYIRDMERGGAWRDFEDLRADVAGEVELGIWRCLVSELVNELEMDCLK